MFGDEEWLFSVMDCRGERNSGFWLEQKVESGAFLPWAGLGRNKIGGEIRSLTQHMCRGRCL